MMMRGLFRCLPCFDGAVLEWCMHYSDTPFQADRKFERLCVERLMGGRGAPAGA
jgi:hypothetical protein